MPTVVDSHHHFWKIARQPPAWRTDAHRGIAADFGPADLGPQLSAGGVDATLLVQSVDTPQENDLLAEYAAAAPFVAGTVGWLPLDEPARARRELERITGPALRGVRCSPGPEPLERWERPETLAVFRELAARGLSWDVVPTTPQQAASVLRIARAVPDLRVVVCHLARPPLDTGAWEPWADSVGDLARAPNIALKVSVGLDVLSRWPAWDGDRLSRYVAWAVRCFGAPRLMLASNWPMVLLRASYAQAWQDQVAAVTAAGVAGSELDDVLGGTAARWYGLGAP